MFSMIPVTQEPNIQELQENFIEQLAISYADQQLVKLVRVIPPRVRVAITLAILVAPWGVEWARGLRKGK
jgi:hypothetical protein